LKRIRNVEWGKAPGNLKYNIVEENPYGKFKL